MNSANDKIHPPITRSMCGRTGCVALYTTNDCHLCEVASNYLKELIKAEGLTEEIIKIIDSDYQINEPNFDEILSRPAIRVCETVVTGLPDHEKMKSTLKRAASMNCFSENIR